MIDEPHLTEWKGIPVVQFDPEGEKPDYENKIYRLGFNWDNEVMLSELFDKFLENDEVNESQGISFGPDCEECSEFYKSANDRIIELKDQFPKLRFMFLGEMIGEESELSWIGQGDVGAPILEAFPALEDLRARGGVDYGDDTLRFSACRHICLENLVLQTCGMPKDTIVGLQESVFPELKQLEIWPGDEDRGRTCGVEDIVKLAEVNPFPKLETLAIKNYDQVTELVPALADTPMLKQIKHLDLSEGTLQNAAVPSLLDHPSYQALETITVKHHYMSAENADKFNAVEGRHSSEREEADEWDDRLHYYVGVSE